MMIRSATTLLLLLSAPLASAKLYLREPEASSAEAFQVEAVLPDTVPLPSIEEEPSMAVTATVDGNDGSDAEKKKEKPPPIVGCMKKGIKCMGGGFPMKYGGKNCTGGVMMDVTATKPKEMLWDIVKDLESGIEDAMGFSLSSDKTTGATDLMDFDQVWIDLRETEASMYGESRTVVEDFRDGDITSVTTTTTTTATAEEEEEPLDFDISKTVEFGGKAYVEWGCKITFAMKKGKLSKTKECGFKGAKGIGKKMEEGLEFDFGY